MLKTKAPRPHRPRKQHANTKPTSSRHAKRSTKLTICITAPFSTSAETFAPQNPVKQKGSIELFMGPMFSGKTTHLLSRFRQIRESGECSSPLLIKHSSDTRYHGMQHVVSHTNIREEAIAVHMLGDPEIKPILDSSTHVFIDEGQFFPDLNPVVDHLARSGKKVYIAALDGTFQREPFPTVAAIIPKVDHIVKLLSVCHTCGEDAPFSKRLSDEKEVHVVGGQDKYQAACRECYHI